MHIEYGVTNPEEIPEEDFMEIFIKRENLYRSVTQKIVQSNIFGKTVTMFGGDFWATQGMDSKNPDHILIQYNRRDVLAPINDFLIVGLHELGHHIGESSGDGMWQNEITREIKEKLKIDEKIAEKLSRTVITNCFEDIRCDNIMQGYIPAFRKWMKARMYKDVMQEREEIKEKGKEFWKEKGNKVNLGSVLLQKIHDFYIDNEKDPTKKILDKTDLMNKEEKEVYNKIIDFNAAKYSSTNSMNRGIFNDVLPHIIDYLQDIAKNIKQKEEFEKMLGELIEKFSKILKERTEETEEGKELKAVVEKKEIKVPEFKPDRGTEFAPGEGSMSAEIFYLEGKLRRKTVKFNHKLDYREFEREIKPLIFTLTTTIKSVLVDNKRAREVPNKRRGRLDYNRLYKAECYNNRIFTKSELLSKKDYAFCLLVDESGSMQGSKIHEAVKSALLTERALSGNNLPFMFAGYTDHLYVYKHFDADVDNRNILCTGRAVCHQETTIGNPGDNSDGWAVWNSAQLLNERKERTKIMIVFTDGIPASHGRYCGHNKFSDGGFKKIVTEVGNTGIYVIGIGIINQYVKNYYEHYVEIRKDVTELPKKIGEILRRIIRKREN